MATASVQASKQINQPASKIYGAIADYQKHHPNFLPRNYFKKLEIESGGVGAGTIFKADMDVYGNKSTLRMKVTEPQPGRVIQETDLASGLFTTFTVEPLGAAQSPAAQSKVTITTQWQQPDGLKGWLQSKVQAFFMGRIYKEELDLLANYLEKIVTT